jgi:hypothetical protein
MGKHILSQPKGRVRRETNSAAPLVRRPAFTNFRGAMADFLNIRNTTQWIQGFHGSSLRSLVENKLVSVVAFEPFMVDQLTPVGNSFVITSYKALPAKR